MPQSPYRSGLLRFSVHLLLKPFYQNAGGDVFHTYSTYGRGLDPLLGTYVILELVPKGRDEDRFAFTMEWVRYHDSYATDEFADADKPYWPPTPASSAATCSL